MREYGEASEEDVATVQAGNRQWKLPQSRDSRRRGRDGWEKRKGRRFLRTTITQSPEFSNPLEDLRVKGDLKTISGEKLETDLTSDAPSVAEGSLAQGSRDIPPASASQVVASCCGESRAQAVGTREVSQVFPGGQQ